MKLDPVTVNVSARLPAGALEGEIEVTLGTGFCVRRRKRRILLPPQPVSTSAKALMQPTPESEGTGSFSGRRYFRKRYDVQIDHLQCHLSRVMLKFRQGNAALHSAARLIPVLPCVVARRRAKQNYVCVGIRDMPAPTVTVDFAEQLSAEDEG